MEVTQGVYVGTEGLGRDLTQRKAQRSWGAESNCAVSHGEGEVRKDQVVVAPDLKLLEALVSMCASWEP